VTVFGDKVESFEHRRDSALEGRAEEESRLKKAQQGILDVEQAQRIVQTVAQTVQQQAHEQIASVVSRCMEAVFDDPYEFKIVFEQKRGKTEAKLTFVRNEMEIDPMTASGGGVVDVAAFALRLACLIMSRPQKRRLLVMDEGFRFLSRDLRPRVKELLLTLAKEMQIQFVMVTHDEILTVGKVVEVG